VTSLFGLILSKSRKYGGNHPTRRRMSSRIRRQAYEHMGDRTVEKPGRSPRRTAPARRRFGSELSTDVLEAELHLSTTPVPKTATITRRRYRAGRHYETATQGGSTRVYRRRGIPQRRRPEDEEVAIHFAMPKKS